MGRWWMYFREVETETLFCVHRRKGLLMISRRQPYIYIRAHKTSLMPYVMKKTPKLDKIERRHSIKDVKEKYLISVSDAKTL